MTKQSEKHQDERVQLYEVGCLVVPTVAEEQLPGVVEGIRKILKDNQAEVVFEGAPVLRDLAYEIAKASIGKKQNFERTYFGFVVFKATSEASLQLLIKLLVAIDKILRFIFIKTDEETAMAPKIVPEALEEKTEDAATPDEAKIPEEDIDKKIDTLVTN